MTMSLLELLIGDLKKSLYFSYGYSRFLFSNQKPHTLYFPFDFLTMKTELKIKMACHILPGGKYQVAKRKMFH